MFHLFRRFWPALRYDSVMAKRPSQDEFLGGGVAFNQVGSAPSKRDPEEAEAVVPRSSMLNGRTLLIVALIVLLAIALYVVSDTSLGGVIHTNGHGAPPGAGQPAGPPQPDRNF